MQARFLGQRLVAEADVEPARRHDEVVGDLDVDAVDAAVDRGGRLDVVLHALEADPHAGKARQREAQDAVVEDLLHAARIEHRHHVVDEGELGLVRAGRAFAGVVVAHQGQHAAVLGGAGVVGVAEHVAGAVDAGALAVPDAEHAVVLAFAAQLGLLRAPQRRGGQVLVEAGHELDVVRLQQALGAQHGRFQGGDRRAAVAGHVAGRVEPRLHVAGALRQHQAHDRLGAGQDLPAFVEGVFVVEASRVFDHMGREPPGILCGPLAASRRQPCISMQHRCQSPQASANLPWPEPTALLALRDGEQADRPQSIVARRKPACLPLSRAAADCRFLATKLPVMPSPKPCPAPARMHHATAATHHAESALYNPPTRRFFQRAQRARPATAGPAPVRAGHPRAHAQFVSDNRSAGVS